MNPSGNNPDTDVVLEYMLRLAQAYLACGEQTAKVELVVRRAASAYGMRRSRAVVFPTAIFVSLDDGNKEINRFIEGPTQALRLDQMADVYELGETTQSGEISPRDGLKKLTSIFRKPARFGLAGVILGHTILTVGVAIVLMPAPSNLAATALLGTIVGILKSLNRNRPMLAVPLSVVAAALVSGLVFLALERGYPVDPLHALAPPLVTFLPGTMLTLGMVELAYGDMVSGSSRLTTGFVQLVLLAFGLAAGAMLVGYHPDDLIEASPEQINMQWSLWAPWVGAVVFGAGAYFHFSAPHNSLGWMMLVLLLVFASQQFAFDIFGGVGGAFIGMLVATPLSYLIQLQFKGPPAMVTFLPSFWLLVPGALGLLSVKRMLSDRPAGIDGLVTTVFVFSAIAVGSLVGASLYKMVTEWFNWRQLQIGRVGSFFRRRRKR